MTTDSSGARNLAPAVKLTADRPIPPFLPP
jgi:hypothetical protein